MLTHRYSKTKHIASFVGIAPVNNPAITVAVVIDYPQRDRRITAQLIARPSFAEVAQEVLEYLGVPHDTQLWSRNRSWPRTCRSGPRWKMHHQNTPAISTRSLPKSTICLRMIRFAAR